MIRFSRRHLLALTAAGTAAALSPLPLPLPLHASTTRVAVNAAGTAIDGYDTTAYWHIGVPSKGTAAHVVQWAGVPWQFATEQDAAEFATTPAAFAPQYGGYCTRAMSFEKIVNGDPEVWRIYADKLYLFALPVGGVKFDEGADAMIAKAQSFWDTLG